MYKKRKKSARGQILSHNTLDTTALLLSKKWGVDETLLLWTFSGRCVDSGVGSMGLY